jgi:hypothetical protein
MWKQNVDKNATDEERKQITELFRKASAKYWIPLSTIPFLESSSVVSVCMKCKDENEKETNEEKKKFTMLFRKALAICWAPLEPIEFDTMASVVSVYSK